MSEQQPTATHHAAAGSACCWALTGPLVLRLDVRNVVVVQQHLGQAGGEGAQPVCGRLGRLGGGCGGGWHTSSTARDTQRALLPAFTGAP